MHGMTVPRSMRAAPDHPGDNPTDPTAYGQLTRERTTLAHDDRPRVDMIVTSAGVLPCTITLEQYRRGGAT